MGSMSRSSSLIVDHSRYTIDVRDANTLFKLFSCLSLLFFSVSATLFTEASRSVDGAYPYNTFTIPCIVEATKLCASGVLLLYSNIKGEVVMSFSFLSFFSFSLPALCYFVSNNCMFFIIRELGPTTFQITNNLKILATGVLMRFFLGRTLTWLRWKALVLLVIGSAVTQLKYTANSGVQSSLVGYVYVFINAFASGAGGVISEKLLKGNSENVMDSIHWQNMQLYFFGLVFGLGSSFSTFRPAERIEPLAGFNAWAYATVASLAAAGLTVSYILKYLDNFVKCFVAAVSMIVVAVVHASLENKTVPLELVIGILLTCMALEQYNLAQ